MNLVRGVAATSAVISLAACRGDVSNDVRGRGLSVAALSPQAQAHVYEAAARASFNLDDPALSLLLDRRLLPRTTGLTSGGRLPASGAAELRRSGAVRGTCEPAIDGPRATARCSAELPGYVVRFSPVFTLRGDSTQVYVYAQKYDTPASGKSDVLRFERAYQVVKRGDEWRAVREGRIPKEVRGEPK